MPSQLLIAVQAGDTLAEVRRLKLRASDAAPLAKDFLLVMIRSTQLNFEAGGRPSRWDDLKQSTIIRRARKSLKTKGGKKVGSLALMDPSILRDTNRLFQSVGGGASGAFEQDEGFGASDEFTAVLGTSTRGWQNQFADTRGWRVAREFLLIQDQDEEDMAAMAMDWLMGQGPYAEA